MDEFSMSIQGIQNGTAPLALLAPTQHFHRALPSLELFT